MNRYFDKIYLLNLDRAKDRLEKVTKELSKENFEYSRFKAIDGWKEGLRVPGKREDWTPGALALNRTTQLILEEAISEGYSNVFIFEDDVNVFQSVWINTGVKQLNGAYLCQAYGINSHMFKPYLEELKKEDGPIDHVTKGFHTSRRNSYGPTAQIVSHDQGSFSYLRDQIVNY
jgi:hypothetical protein